MKFLFGFLLISMSGLYGCSDNTINEDEVTIERQEDYNRESASEDEIQIDRTDEEIDVDE